MVDLPDFMMPDPAVQSSVPDVFEGQVLDDASSVGMPVRVRVPGLSNELATDPCPWLPVVSSAGLFFPKAGDACVVVQPAQGDPWIAAWTPAASMPDEPITGGSDPLKQDLVEKNQPNGYAGLDGAGKLATTALPALSIVDVFTVASQAAQLALTAQQGDVAIRSDESKAYIHNGGSAGTMADWTWVATPGDLVLSVAGKTGAVTLSASDIGDFNAAALSASKPARVSSLPGSPTDGQEVFFDTGTAGVIWYLRYNASASGSYKWEFLGGPPLVAASNTTRSLTNQTSYTNLPTDPLSIELPLSGDFDVKIEAQIQLSGSAGIGRVTYSTDSGGSNASHDWNAQVNLASGQFARVGNETRQTGLTAGNDITEKAQTGGSYQVNFSGRRLSVRPVRVG